jgi:arabinofuranan 3-O-arabinosyltransferase
MASPAPSCTVPRNRSPLLRRARDAFAALFPLDPGLTSGPLAARAPWLLWLLVAFSVTWQFRGAHAGQLLGLDAQSLWLAAEAAVRGESPFSTSFPFVYLPSSALLAWPFGLGSNDVLKGVFLLLTGVGIPLAAALSVRLVGMSARSWLAALLALATTLTLPGQYAYSLLNFMIVALVMLPFVLAQMRAVQWTSCGVLVGVSIAVKPMLVPLGWFALIDRRWRALAVMAGIPLVLSLLALALLPEPDRFFTEVLPWLLQGEDETLWPYLSALLPVGLVQGWPLAVVNAVRLGVAALGLVLATLLWRRTADQTLRVVESTGLLLAASFLAFSAATPTYLLLLLPLLASSVRAGAIAANPVAWVGVLVAAAPGFPGDDWGTAGISRRVAVGLLVAFLAWSWSAMTRLRAAGDTHAKEAVAPAS